MKKLTILGIFSLGLVLLVGTALITAQEPMSEDGKLLFTSEDNACYEGGSMAGKCEDSEWAWKCGWYLTRYEQGDIAYEEMNSDCMILMPPLPEPEPAPITIVSADGQVVVVMAAPDGTCYTNGTFDLLYAGDDEIQYLDSSDGGCLGSTVFTENVAQAGSQGFALLECSFIDSSYNNARLLQSDGFNTPANLWECFSD